MRHAPAVFASAGLLATALLAGCAVTPSHARTGSDQSALQSALQSVVDAPQREAANRDREDELADGHIDIRWAGFVSVATPGTDAHQRQRSVDRVKAQATRCGMRLEVMSGQQADALTFVLPFGRGLR